MPVSSNRNIAIVGLGALLLVLILAAIVLLAKDDENAPIEILVPPATTPVQASDNPSPAQFSGQPTELQVYVSGAVVNPGVYTMAPGDRVTDAVAAAGGATSDAQLSAINMALRVQDEGQYHVPSVGETPPVSSAPLAGQSQPRTGDSGLLDLNTALAAELEDLPGIGEILAAAIIDYRETNGGFQSIQEITEVPRIGPATFEKIREFIVVGSGQ